VGSWIRTPGKNARGEKGSYIADSVRKTENRKRTRRSAAGAKKSEGNTVQLLKSGGAMKY